VIDGAPSDALVDTGIASTDATIDTTISVDTGPPVPPGKGCNCCGTPFNAPLVDHPRAVISNVAGDLIVAGNVSFGGSTGPLWLGQINDDGSTAWQKTLDGEIAPLIAFLELTAGGYVFLRSEGGGTIGARAVRTDDKGSRVWTKAIAADKFELVARGAAATKQGFVVVGDYRKTPPAGTAWFARYDAEGNLLGDASDPTLVSWHAVSSSRRGRVVMCGSSEDTSRVCMMLGEEGGSLWRRTIPIDWTAGRVAVAEDNSVYLAGTKYLDVPRPGETFPGHVMIAKLDPAGTLLWQKERGPSQLSEMNVESLVATPDHGFALAGQMSDVRYMRSPDAAPPDLTWRWGIALRGLPDGTISWAKGYSPTGPPGADLLSIAGCTEGVVAVGASYAGRWMLRSDPKGLVPIAAPGTSIDW
jgi:hypothetical protein